MSEWIKKQKNKKGVKNMANKFYEIRAQNRVVCGSFSKRRIRGTQGNWYDEFLYFLTESEDEAKEMASKEIKKRPVKGIPRHTRRNITRQIKIIETRRIA